MVVTNHIRKESKNKHHINLIIIGHIDHGKSTLFGDLLIEIGDISEREQRELQRIAKEHGRESIWQSFILDKLKEERNSGNTVDLAFRKLNTNEKSFTIIDAPGHRDFVKNMITGASQADAAVIVVSGKKGEAEVGCTGNGQTREHVYLAQTLGVKQIIVAINKADLWNYDLNRYNEVKKIVSDLLKNVGYSLKNIKFVPVSGLTGENVVRKSSKMSWYNEETLLEALNDLQEPENTLNTPLRLSVQDTYSIKGQGVVPVGKINSGVLKVGDKIIINPGGFTGEIRSMEMHHESIQVAEQGFNIGFSIRGLMQKDVKRGAVLGHEKNPPNVIYSGGSFLGQIIVINHPTVITPGYTPICHIATSYTAVKFLEIKAKLDAKTGNIIEKNPKFIKNGERAIVKLQPLKTICAEKYSEFPGLGRFAIRDSGQTVAVGIIKEIN